MPKEIQISAEFDIIIDVENNYIIFTGGIMRLSFDLEDLQITGVLKKSLDFGSPYKLKMSLRKGGGFYQELEIVYVKYDQAIKDIKKLNQIIQNNSSKHITPINQDIH